MNKKTYNEMTKAELIDRLIETAKEMKRIKKEWFRLKYVDYPYDLIKEYFANKKRIKELKRERYEYATSNKCTSNHKDEILNDLNCCDNYSYIFENKDRWCKRCKKVNYYYENIQKLSHRNTGIMNKLRNIVK